MKRIPRRARHRALAIAAVSSGVALVATHPVYAQNSEPADTKQTPVESAVQEVLVTASRRSTGVVELPYNISAYGGAQLQAAGTTSLAELASTVPGLALEDRGARYAAASVPIIRGLNASDPNRGGQITEQLPVGIYLGNTPTSGYYPIDDIQRVEVLRGPQGTLYGAGALGGAVRLIPNDPKLNTWEAEVGTSGKAVAHSSDLGYTGSALLNAPIGSIAAIRLSAKYDYQPGFIDQFGILARSSDGLDGVPLLADPTDVANSPGVYYTKKDSNETKVTSARLSLLVQPVSELSIQAAFNISHVEGHSAPVDNPTFNGGASTFDPRITLPATGEYQIVDPFLPEYSRDSRLASLDVSYDLGFATLASTTSYEDIEGKGVDDFTNRSLLLDPSYLAYYAGNPYNPRFVSFFSFPDTSHNFAQELRLVSTAGSVIDYVVGAYYSSEGKQQRYDIFEPGTTAQAIASGGVPVPTDDQGRVYISTLKTQFTDKSLFGELTWHISKRWQVTGGTRFFKQSFDSLYDFNLLLFGLDAKPVVSNSVSDHIFKANTSYEFIDDHRVYATFSQGFRRGGANAFTTEGILREPVAIQAYKPDTADNFEVGFKGRFENGMQYTADIFYIDWKDAQIGTTTPVNGWPVTVNAPKARSKGFELELTTPLGVPNLTGTLGYAYVKAELAQSFCLPTGEFSDTTFAPCGIGGTSGERLPGTPENSGMAAVNYKQSLPGNLQVNYTLSGDYKSSTAQRFGPLIGTAVNLENPSYWTLNGNVTLQMESWRFGFYGRNLLDHRAVLASPERLSDTVGTLPSAYTISRPREIGMQVNYAF